MGQPELHPDLSLLRGLVGTWTGTGEGSYPTIEPFTYHETSVFSHVGKPFLAYVQRTTSPDGLPRHTESGYLRMPEAPGVELVIAHPTGHVEVGAGTVSGGLIVVRSTSVTATPSAKSVVAVERELALDGDVLRYVIRMAAVGQPMTHHLAAELRRVPA